MLGDLWAFHRRAVLSTAAGLVAVVVLVGLAASSSSESNGRGPVPSATTVPASPGTSLPPGTVDPKYHPTYISVPPPSPGSQVPENQVKALEAVKPPAPLYSPSMPALSDTQTVNAENFAYAFVPRLLDIHFAHETRQELGEWTEAEAAASMLPGLPAAAADSTLYASLFVPGLPGGGRSPMPSRAQWAADAKDGVVWHVVSMAASEDPQWAQAIAAGYQAPDQLMSILDVSGVLAVRSGGHTTDRHFTFQLLVGSALHHPNFGAGEVLAWKAS
ncbi:hypothetical protein K6U06_05780 [Acidiferrimicrobium sp. IK]|uniref:hypothetical protein n=1 Tax=Acidiferrimicrobium sp. IK TaxID=2871700 RepID=UPI0021CB68AB|nr:hypothetical protein [Acidiferrimicrobium sp. IK]MCU4183862.1 hypothetical protein [Acidiferrimicrobium sp. IK]